MSKFADHVPLYRLCQICGRDGVEMSRSTITDMISNCGVLLTPLADAVGRYVLKAQKVHGDDTPIRALGGKGEKAHTARLWVYVRDDRASDDKAPPAVWFQYSADRKGEHPARHLRNCSGILQADAYSGYNAIYKDGRILQAGCWSHARRKLWDIHVKQKRLPGTLAHEGFHAGWPVEARRLAFKSLALVSHAVVSINCADSEEIVQRSACGISGGGLAHPGRTPRARGRTVYGAQGDRTQ